MRRLRRGCLRRAGGGAERGRQHRALRHRVGCHGIEHLGQLGAAASLGERLGQGDELRLREFVEAEFPGALERRLGVVGAERGIDEADGQGRVRAARLLQPAAQVGLGRHALVLVEHDLGDRERHPVAGRADVARELHRHVLLVGAHQHLDHGQRQLLVARPLGPADAAPHGLARLICFDQHGEELQTLPLGLQSLQVVGAAQQGRRRGRFAVDREQLREADHVLGASVALVATRLQRGQLVGKVAAEPEHADGLLAGGFGILGVDLAQQGRDVGGLVLGVFVEGGEAALHRGVTRPLLGEQFQHRPGLGHVAGLLVEARQLEQRTRASVAGRETILEQLQRLALQTVALQHGDALGVTRQQEDAERQGAGEHRRHHEMRGVVEHERTGAVDQGFGALRWRRRQGRHRHRDRLLRALTHGNPS